MESITIEFFYMVTVAIGVFAGMGIYFAFLTGRKKGAKAEFKRLRNCKNSKNHSHI